jgi:hypothetical protein
MHAGCVLCAPPILPAASDPPTSDPPDLFFRLARVYRQNEQLMQELARSRSRITEALRYLSQPDANRVLGQARLSQLRARRSNLLCRLRANRIEVRGLI